MDQFTVGYKHLP